jgi:hypothetical protein
MSVLSPRKSNGLYRRVTAGTSASRKPHSLLGEAVEPLPLNQLENLELNLQ